MSKINEKQVAEELAKINPATAEKIAKITAKGTSLALITNVVALVCLFFENWKAGLASLAIGFVSICVLIFALIAYAMREDKKNGDAN